MSPSSRLSAFKILKDVVWVSAYHCAEDKESINRFFRNLADRKINLPFITYIKENYKCHLNLVVGKKHALTTTYLIEAHCGKASFNAIGASILSVFPHKSDPGIMGSFLDLFHKNNISPGLFANSHSAISVVLPHKDIEKSTNALFDTFTFSTYRTPADWRLAQKGKEVLYREVVASYQEKKPKVYGLQWSEKNEILQIILNRDSLSTVGAVFNELSNIGIHLTFLSTIPQNQTKGEATLFFCLPEPQKRNYESIIKKLPPLVLVSRKPSIALFFMNGPHFGDRYGIINELLASFNNARVEPLALSCSIASIIGVISRGQIHQAIEAIQDCFDVPTITKQDP
jgi:aspartokinase